MLEAPDAAAGRSGACKFCQARIIAPAAAGQPGRVAEPAGVGAAPPPSSAPPPPPPPWTADDPFRPPPAPAPTPGRAYLDYADLWRRFWAHVIDNILLAAVLIPLVFAMQSPSDAAVGRGSNMFLLVAMGIEWAYYTLMECSPYQATLGKMALGLMVVDTQGQRLSFWRAGAREAGKWVSQYTCLIGYLMAMFNDKSQTLHDLIGGTVVVER
jgi:uncharacterized RDD family membrane protein YckC